MLLKDLSLMDSSGFKGNVGMGEGEDFRDLSLMDSSGFRGGVGMGEREARCASGLVRRRHFGMTHGMGRSGNIADEQPKVGSETTLHGMTMQ
ncbi:unnamed protein product [Closterium sp. NIES-65]|nr:unnamed protein product [Closterium sp. NIES-65]